MSLADTPGSWPVVDSTDLHRDDWVVALRRDRITAPGGDPADADQVFGRLVLEHPGAALVLAIDDDERVCLLRQYRHPGPGTFIELPAGLCDVAGEDPVETAKRELAEEAGLAASEWRHLLTTYPSVGISAERHHFYLARGVTAVDRPDGFVVAHEEAHLEVLWAPFGEVVDAVLGGQAQEGPLAVAVLAYDALRRRENG
ncbi:NUDIX hydrolase [Nocardioides panacisoli]|uniref:NUDIX hydrolase n=1 Tax=Nocardioides panacisoli TaxID=627624 RepID=A0ABP7J7S7_9ACTN